MGRKRTPKKAVRFSPNCRSPYLESAFNVKSFRITINTAIKAIKKFEKKTPFEAIAFSGVSGAAIAFPLSYLLNKPLLCVRKSTEDTHSADLIEGCDNAPRYIIVDDFIASGETIRRIKKEIKNRTKGELVGIYLFAMNKSDNTWGFKKLVFSVPPVRSFDLFPKKPLKKKSKPPRRKKSR